MTVLVSHVILQAGDEHIGSEINKIQEANGYLLSTLESLIALKVIDLSVS